VYGVKSCLFGYAAWRITACNKIMDIYSFK